MIAPRSAKKIQSMSKKSGVVFFVYCLSDFLLVHVKESGIRCWGYITVTGLLYLFLPDISYPHYLIYRTTPSFTGPEFPDTDRIVPKPWEIDCPIPR